MEFTNPKAWPVVPKDTILIAWGLLLTEMVSTKAISFNVFLVSSCSTKGG